jgi:uncharacterized protein (TIGR02118 family)
LRASTSTVKLTFLFNNPEGPDVFDDYLFEPHLPLNEAVTQLSRRDVAMVAGTPDGGPAPYHVIAEYYFASMENNEAGRRLNEDLANFVGAGSSAFISHISGSESRPIYPSA